MSISLDHVNNDINTTNIVIMIFGTVLIVGVVVVSTLILKRYVDIYYYARECGDSSPSPDSTPPGTLQK